MMPPRRLWLVEDEPRYRDAFAQMMAHQGLFALDAIFEQFEDLATTLRAGVPPPEIVVLDVQLPGMSGLEATRALRHAHPALPIVILTMHDAPGVIFAALRAGASGYLVKGTPPAQMMRAIEEAYDGGTYFAAAVARHVLGHFESPEPDDEPLSGRETEVLRELAAGRTKAVIAERLFLSPHTVDKHVRSIYHKLQVNTAAGAVAKGVRTGLV